MPVGHKNFLFRHFEKIACGVAGLFLLVAIGYGVQRVTGGEVDEATQEISRLTSRLETQMKATPPELDITNYVKQWRAARAVKDPGEVQEIFWYPWPVYYAEKRFASNEEYELEFQEPLARQSVKVEEEVPAGKVIKNVIHPVGVDYSRVQVTTGNVDLGEAMIVGKVGERAHRMPIVVDEEIRERAEPPVDVTAQAVKEGIIIRWKKNPQNTEAIQLDAYEIYRKQAQKVTGEFQKVAEVEVKGKSESSPATKKKPARPGRREGREDREETTAAPAYDYRWKDPVRREGDAGGDGARSGVRTGGTYIYKVRSIASNSEPPNSEFSALVRATALPTVDYQFSSQSGDVIRFKVRVYHDGRVDEEECAVRVGEEIGVYREEADGWQNFLTDSFLLDFQPNALRRDPFAQGRVIVLNRRGQIEARWRGETKVPYLWRMEPGETVEDTAPKPPKRVDPDDGGGTRIIQPD